MRNNRFAAAQMAPPVSCSTSSPAGPNAPDACAGPSVWVGPGADYRLPRASINALQILCEYTQQPIPTIRR